MSTAGRDETARHADNPASMLSPGLEKRAPGSSSLLGSSSFRAVLNHGDGSLRRQPQQSLDDGLSSRAAGWGKRVPDLPPTFEGQR